MTFSAYNHAQIPFIYPPLSFYAASLLGDTLRLSDFTLLRFLPAIFSILSVPIFFLFARSILSTETQALLATFSYALLPTAFDLMIVGAGLPRALASCFSLLTLWQCHRLYTSPKRGQLMLVAAFASLTVLSHPTVAWFTLYSALNLFLFWGRHRSGFIQSLWVASATLLFTAPWWVTILVRHGLDPLLLAANTGFRSWAQLLTPLLFMHTSEPYLHLQAVLALLGLFACLYARRYLLPTWLASIFVLEPHLASTYSAAPMALLVAIGMEEVILGGMRNLSDSFKAGEAQENRFSSKIPGVMFAFFLFYAFVSAYIAAPKTALSRDHRAAMQWVNLNTPDVSHFLIISGIDGPGKDLISEWFPALTHRTSLSTPQGRE